MLVCDTGPLYAAAARRDKNHARCVALLTAAPRPLVVPQLVVTEVSYFLSDRLGPAAESRFAHSLANGELEVEPVVPSDWSRIAELTEEYLDMSLGIVDASVVALLERLDLTTVASLDHKHLGAVKPRHAAGLELVP